MTMTSSLSNALSGLAAASRGINVVSTNVANALTEGYAPRILGLSSRSVDGAGAGVTVDGVFRVVDPVLLADRRIASSAAAGSDARSNALAAIETAVGDPTDEGSLTGRIAAFEAALLTAGSRPDSTVRLDEAVARAGEVALALNTISDEIQEIRQDADSGIARDVATINAALQDIQDLDVAIFRLGAGGRDVTALEDQRQAAIDRVSELVPVREVSRDGGRIALFTTGGAVLYDGRAVELGFTPRPAIEPTFSLSGGPLSGLTLNGVSIPVEGAGSYVRGGALAAKFELRDEIAPALQAAVDSVARNVIERFQDPALDTTLGATDPGLFTDDGAAFTPANEVGLAGRIALNALVDPDAGGLVTRLRDGLGAAVPGDAGDATLITALAARLGEAQNPASGPFASVSRSTSGLGAELLSLVASERQSADRTLADDRARLDGIRSEELRNGVDTDVEMQRLLVLEQAYAANARVISTLEDLFDQLARI